MAALGAATAAVTARFGPAGVIGPVTAWQVAVGVVGFSASLTRLAAGFDGCRWQHEFAPDAAGRSVRDRREGHCPATPVGRSFRRRNGVSTVVSTFDEDAVKRRQRAQQVALFRYQLICPALEPGLSTKQRGKVVRGIAGRSHDGPFGGQVRYSRDTLDRWIRRYRAGGFDALSPSIRQAGTRIDAQVFELAAALKRENPGRTAAQVMRILRASTGWAPSESTLLRHFHRLELMGPAAGQAVVFGRFEADAPNERWVGDALHGPKVAGRKTYLFAFLDDHSRLAVGYRFGFAEDTVRLAAALQPALASPRRPRIRICRQRLGLRRCVAAAGLREARDPAGPLHPAPTPRTRKNRKILAHRERSVPRRGPRHHRRRRCREGHLTGGGVAGTERAVHRVGGNRLPPPCSFRDRADPAGPVDRRVGPRRARPGDARGRGVDRGVPAGPRTGW